MIVEKELLKNHGMTGKKKVISNQQEELRKLFEQHIKDNPQAAQRKADKEKEQEKLKEEKAKKKASKPKEIKKAPVIVVTDNSSNSSDIIPVIDKPKKDEPKKIPKDNSKDLKDTLKKPKKDKTELKEEKPKEDLKRTAAPRVTTRTRHTRSPSAVDEITFDVEKILDKPDTTTTRGHSRTISESNVIVLAKKTEDITTTVPESKHKKNDSISNPTPSSPTNRETKEKTTKR